MGSWKLESGVNKEDVREKKRGDSKKKKKMVKHECGIMIILTFEFEQISKLLF